MASNILSLNDKIKRQERLSVNPAAGRFTLQRNDMRRMQDLKLCAQFCDWITELSGGIEVFPDTFVEDLSDGVALLKLVQKFGQVGVMHDRPKTGAKLNAFKARENRLEFIRACSRMDIHALPDIDFSMQSLIPCLLELAAIALSFEILEQPNKALPEGIRRRVSLALQQPMDEPRESAASASSATEAATAAEESAEKAATEAPASVSALPSSTGSASSAGSAGAPADIPPPSKAPGPDTAAKAAAMLKDLTVSSPSRTKPSPPKMRQIEICNRVLSVYERPGFSATSVVWTGSLVLIEFLAESESTHLSKSARVLELGAGVGIIGVWCATLGAHSTVTDRADSMDLLWANVAANAIQILANFGSCVARSLSWNHPEDVSKLKESLSKSVLESDAKREIYMDIMVASDIMSGNLLQPLIDTLDRLFVEFSQELRVFICYKRKSEQSVPNFEPLETKHNIHLKEVGRGRGDRSNYSILSAIRPKTSDSA